MINFFEVSSFVIPLILAITLHEAAHGFAANMLGDDTAKRLGRVTLNPLRHIDRFGTIILPGLLIFTGSPFIIGWAKPVPVLFNRLRHPRSGTLWVSLAGPGTNLVLAFLSALALHLESFVTPEQAPWLYMNLYHSININIVLAIFNMIPVLPLDGGRVLGSLLPPRIAAVYARGERFGLMAVFLLFLAAGFLYNHQIIPFDLMQTLVYGPADWLRMVLLHLAGIGNSAQ
ncbi:MAG TPA: site-2 protease family protein [Rickettsiales bacterium]|nr:site-2 protease family protein [Rickettsiales bacterium]